MGDGVFECDGPAQNFPEYEQVGWVCGGSKTNRPNDDNRCVHLVAEMK